MAARPAISDVRTGTPNPSTDPAAICSVIVSRRDIGGLVALSNDAREPIWLINFGQNVNLAKPFLNLRDAQRR